jgi:hypothetical protein
VAFPSVGARGAAVVARRAPLPGAVVGAITVAAAGAAALGARTPTAGVAGVGATAVRRTSFFSAAGAAPGAEVVAARLGGLRPAVGRLAFSGGGATGFCAEVGTLGGSPVRAGGSFVGGRLTARAGIRPGAGTGARIGVAVLRPSTGGSRPAASGVRSPALGAAVALAGAARGRSGMPLAQVRVGTVAIAGLRPGAAVAAGALSASRGTAGVAPTTLGTAVGATARAAPIGVAGVGRTLRSAGVVATGVPDYRIAARRAPARAAATVTAREAGVGELVGGAALAGVATAVGGAATVGRAVDPQAAVRVAAASTAVGERGGRVIAGRAPRVAGGLARVPG